MQCLPQTPRPNGRKRKAATTASPDTVTKDWRIGIKRLDRLRCRSIVIGPVVDDDGRDVQPGFSASWSRIGRRPAKFVVGEVLHPMVRSEQLVVALVGDAITARPSA